MNTATRYSEAFKRQVVEEIASGSLVDVYAFALPVASLASMPAVARSAKEGAWKSVRCVC